MDFSEILFPIHDWRKFADVRHEKFRNLGSQNVYFVTRFSYKKFVEFGAHKIARMKIKTSCPCTFPTGESFSTEIKQIVAFQATTAVKSASIHFSTFNSLSTPIYVSAHMCVPTGATTMDFSKLEANEACPYSAPLFTRHTPSSSPK